MRRRKALVGLVAVTVLATPGLGLVQAQAVTGSKDTYIVVMKAEPLVRSMTTPQLRSSQAALKSSALRKTHDKVLNQSGMSTKDKVNDYVNALNGFAVTATAEEAVALAKDPDVAVVLRDELRQKAENDKPDGWGSIRVGAHGLYDFLGLNGRGEAWHSGLTGEGVTIGVIDSGIWPEHPSFADDGSYPAHDPLDSSNRSACDFGNTAHNANDAPFTCNNKLVGARAFLDTYKANTGLSADEFDSARDDDGRLQGTRRSRRLHVRPRRGDRPSGR